MKFRSILQKYIINNIGYKILAIVFSFILWLVILNITDPEYTRTISNITVQIENEDKILDGTHVYTISSGDVTSISVTGKRSIISTLLASDFLVTADMEELSITNAVPIKVELTGEKSRYSGQVTIVPRDTSMIINLEDMTSRVIPVELEYRGELEEEIVIDEANISPKKITINAPESITDSAEKAVITANSRNINSDTTMYLTPEIRSASGSVIQQTGDTSLDETEISVEFKVSYKKEIPIAVNVTGTVGEGYRIEEVELSQDTITVKGPRDSIRKASRVSIPGDIINVDGITSDFEMEVDVSPYLPEDIAVYGESPTFTVTVHLQKTEEAAQETSALGEEMSEEAIEESQPETADTPETKEQNETKQEEK